MDVVSLNARSRKVGKRGARAARRDEEVPCVLYGRSTDPVAFQVSEKSLGHLIYTNETHLVDVSLGNDTWRCIVKDIAFHPVTDRPMHADFQVLHEGSRLTLTVPIRYSGTPVGQTRGGDVRTVLNELVVSCLPRNIPSQVDVDVSGVDIGQAIHVRDLEFEHLEFLAPDDQILFTIVRPRRIEEEEETAEEEEPGEIPEE